MKFAELSRRTGVPAPTLKYYLREGLLPAGRRTKPNQAQYDVRHVRRIRLIKAMQDVCGMSIATIREVLATVDSADGDLHTVLGAGQCAPTAVARARAELAQSASGQSAGGQSAGGQPGGAQPVGTDAVPRRAGPVPDRVGTPTGTPVGPPAATGPGPAPGPVPGPGSRAYAEAVRLVRERGWAIKPDTPALAVLTDLVHTLHTLDQCDIVERLPQYAELAEAIARVDLALVCARANVDSMVEGVIVGNTLGDALMATLRRLAQESLSAERFGSVRTTGERPADEEGHPCPS